MIDTYLNNLVRVFLIAGAFALIPLVASFADLQPPWPPAIGYVSAGLVILASLIVWEWVRKSRTTKRRIWIIVATVLTVIGLFGYLTLYSLFVERIPGSGDRVVRGYVCTVDALAIYKAKCPDLPREALQDAEWESLALWTRGSVTAVRLWLTLSWITFMAGLVAAVGAVVAGRKFATKSRDAAVTAEPSSSA